MYHLKQEKKFALSVLTKKLNVQLLHGTGKQPPLKLLAPRRWRNVACGKERLEEVRLFSQTSFCKAVFESILVNCVC